jgi:hypothetical protein
MQSQYSFAGISESTKGLTLAFWLENGTHDNASMKQESWSPNYRVQNGFLR